MTGPLQISLAKDLRWGKDPKLDAWINHFKTENNVEYLLNPEKVASDEQLRFMVALAEDQAFFPCSDETLRLLMQKVPPKELVHEYRRIWRFIIKLVRHQGLDKYNEQRIIQYCRHRFRHHLASRIMIPSRLVKRLASIALTQLALEDPYEERKQRENQRALNFLRKASTDKLIHSCPPECAVCTDTRELRGDLDFLELKRLLYLSTLNTLWEDASPSQLDVEQELQKPCGECSHLRLLLGAEDEEPKKVLYLPDTSGGFVFDLAIIRRLLRMGHQVVLALKAGFLFSTPTMWDIATDPVLKELVSGAHVLPDQIISKKGLLQQLREHRFLIISDGTREQLNLYKTSVTFARAWKECDLVLAKGGRNFQNLIQCSHEFTRDIASFHRDKDGKFRLYCKTRARSVRKFTEADLTGMADRIIADMRSAKGQGRTVMFYSAVIGSIPGQTKTAVRVVDTFVQHLRSKLDDAFIINPAEHFEEGMDGDDLMFMWERVQRSGFLDVWRFQTVEDVEASFALMGKKVPPMWSGKDSTFSTGCTQEMRIALETQKRHPELQIIGPSAEKFFRRAEYGVGKYYDAGIKVM